MSFVDHHGEVEYPYSQKTVFDALMAASNKIDGLELDSADEVSGRVTLKAGVSLRSWGENIPVQLVSVTPVRTRVQIMSTPKTGVMFGGAMDLGKNRQNIEKIIRAVSDELAGKEPEKETASIDTATVSDELIKLKQLLDQGVLTQEEFDEQKRKLLSASQSGSSSKESVSSPANTEQAAPVRIEGKEDNTVMWVIIAAIIIFVISMLASIG